MNHQKIKVLWITYEFGKNMQGGIARVINGVSEKLIPEIDLDVLVDKCKYSLSTINWPFAVWEIFIKTRKYKLYQFRNGAPKVSHYPNFQRALIRLIREEKYDIVHLFHIGDYPESAIQVIRQNFPELKIVYSCHSVAKYDMALRKSYSNQLGYEYRIINNIDHLHVLNRTSLEYLKQSHSHTDKPFTYSVIPNGIDETGTRKQAPYFARKIQRLSKPDQITVLFMSRWSHGKGIEYLLEAIPKVIGSNKNIRFILAGRKSNSWENEYSTFRQTLDQTMKDMKENVTVLGWLNDSKRNTLFAQADIWVMPSLLEYFPYSILEPMIAKIPIVSARIDSVKEMLEEDKECLFYDSRDSEQLAKKILTLAGSPELRRQIAQNAYQKAKRLYQWNAVSKMYLKMYRDLLDGVPMPKF